MVYTLHDRLSRASVERFAGPVFRRLHSCNTRAYPSLTNGRWIVSDEVQIFIEGEFVFPGKDQQDGTYWVRRVRDLHMNIHPVEDIAIQAGLITVHCDRIVAVALKIEIDL